ncbi:TVP38/TMEM64 family protein, partial [bacterium]|nr:TVP38/TMEM64 family protein [bacterium]
MARASANGISSFRGSNGKEKGWKKAALLAVLVLAVVISGFFLPLREYLTRFLEWVGDLGWVGYFVFVGLYIAACILFLPGVILTMGAGLIYGVVTGTVLVSLGSVIGASAAFLAGRFFARDWVASRVGENEKFRAVDRAVGNQGFKVVLLLRLTPIFPFNLLNYALGLT